MGRFEKTALWATPLTECYRFERSRNGVGRRLDVKVLIQIAYPAPEKMLTWPYESSGSTPIPEVGDQIMGYELGARPVLVVRRLYHYLPEEITVRLVCRYLTVEDFIPKSV
jgi:hypothetical protein